MAIKRLSYKELRSSYDLCERELERTISINKGLTDQNARLAIAILRFKMEIDKLNSRKDALEYSLGLMQHVIREANIKEFNEKHPLTRELKKEIALAALEKQCRL